MAVPVSVLLCAVRVTLKQPETGTERKEGLRKRVQAALIMNGRQTRCI